MTSVIPAPQLLCVPGHSVASQGAERPPWDTDPGLARFAARHADLGTDPYEAAVLSAQLNVLTELDKVDFDRFASFADVLSAQDPLDQHGEQRGHVLGGAAAGQVRQARRGPPAHVGMRTAGTGKVT
jgi:hypothetical protein